MGLGVKAKIFHTSSGRTSVGERVADVLSKVNMEEVHQEMPGNVIYIDSNSESSIRKQ